jgi:hypothetical protein
MTIKETYQEKLETQLEEWKAEMMLLKAKLGTLKADAKIKVEEELDFLSDQQEAASEKLKELKKAGDDVWEQTKAGAELLWTELKSGMISIKKHFV